MTPISHNAQRSGKRLRQKVGSYVYAFVDHQLRSHVWNRVCGPYAHLELEHVYYQLVEKAYEGT